MNNHEFEQLYKQHKSFITAALKRFIRNREMINDIVQETFIKAYIARESFKYKSAYKTWLYRIAINTAYQMLKDENKNNRKLYAYFVHLENNRPKSLLQSISTSQDLDILNSKIQKLPPKLQKPIIMYAVFELEYKKIATVLSVPIGTIRSQINRARKLLSDYV